MNEEMKMPEKIVRRCSDPSEIGCVNKLGMHNPADVCEACKAIGIGKPTGHTPASRMPFPKGSTMNSRGTRTLPHKPRS